jgi:hypothetical protein
MGGINVADVVMRKIGSTIIPVVIPCITKFHETFNKISSMSPETEAEVTAKSYTLWTEHGDWLGQIVLTSDGMFAGVTDYGNLNFSFAWRRTGDNDFRKFLIGLNTDYFATKMATGMGYIAHGKKIDQACKRFAEKILPPLQELLKKEIENQNS